MRAKRITFGVKENPTLGAGETLVQSLEVEGKMIKSWWRIERKITRMTRSRKTVDGPAQSPEVEKKIVKRTERKIRTGDGPPQSPQIEKRIVKRTERKITIVKGNLLQSGREGRTLDQEIEKTILLASV